MPDEKDLGVTRTRKPKKKPGLALDGPPPGPPPPPPPPPPPSPPNFDPDDGQ